jgi:hypothetical protein
MEVLFAASQIYPDAKICVCCVGLFLVCIHLLAGAIRITFWNPMQRVDYEETTQGGWLTVSGRDIFISSH